MILNKRYSCDLHANGGDLVQKMKALLIDVPVSGISHPNMPCK